MYTSTKVWVVECDECGEYADDGGWHDNVSAALEAAGYMEWHHEDDCDYCPECWSKLNEEAASE